MWEFTLMMRLEHGAAAWDAIEDADEVAEVYEEKLGRLVEIKKITDTKSGVSPLS